MSMLCSIVLLSLTTAEQIALLYTIKCTQNHHGLPLHDTSSDKVSQLCLSHLSEWHRGSSICNVINVMAESSTIRASAFLPSASLSPFSTTGLTRCCRNKLARTATNSTCENFLPTHSRGPSAQGMKVPGSGSMKVSFAIGDVWLSLLLDGEEDVLSHRLGRQSRASEPQV